MLSTTPLVPASCLRCRAPIFVPPQGMIGGIDRDIELLGFDYHAPKGPGDIRLLLAHDCEDEDDGYDDGDPFGPDGADRLNEEFWG